MEVLGGSPWWRSMCPRTQPMAARSKTRTPWKYWKARKIFSEIFKSEFSILAVGKNRKLGMIYPRFPRFPRFPSFRFATLSFSLLVFFFFFKNGFSVSLFYVCNYSSNLYFLYKYNYDCRNNEI